MQSHNSFYQCPSCDSWRTLFTQEKGSSADIPKWSWKCVSCGKRTSIRAMYFNKFGYYPIYEKNTEATEESNEKLRVDRIVSKMLKDWGMEE